MLSPYRSIVGFAGSILGQVRKVRGRRLKRIDRSPDGMATEVELLPASGACEVEEHVLIRRQ